MNPPGKASPLTLSPARKGEAVEIVFAEATEPLELTEFLPKPSADLPFLETIDDTDVLPAPQVVAEPLILTDAHVITQPADPRGLIGRVWDFVCWCVRTAFGIVSLIALLALLAAIPGVNFYVLGYLLEVEGRVARSGRLRDAFPLVKLAPRLGSIALGVWLWTLPIRLLASMAADAHLIGPGSASDRNLYFALRAVAVAVAVHLCLALARGGSLTCFIRPIKNVRWLLSRVREGNYWTTAERAIADFIVELRIKHHLWLGLRGFVGAMLWLAIPTALLASSRQTSGGAFVVVVFGGLQLMFVFNWLPFLQAHFAAENRLRGMFALLTVWRRYIRAPFSWLITLLLTLTLSLPMYLFKVVLPPQDAMWLETLVFIVTIYPLKVIAGWAYHRATVREQRPWSLFSLLVSIVGWGLVQLVLGLYVVLVFFTQFIGEHGKGVLFEHHAFLLPVPF
ncbi:MAG: hypothetical protein HZA46_16245 [Planctomycetales bacterium]|nr:hypothetical protein [Planctomycetales bacterium]